jgi:CDP-diacylglycerol--glycerol-3-phosphate 3-phosphatidyltransferase
MSIYALKGRFQDLLRPGVRGLFRAGVTANQVTVFAALVSLAVAFVVWRQAPVQPLLYLLLPAWMLLRMALNAVDGMLAREFGQQSRLGAYLNELSDVIADAALYLSLLSVPGVHAHALWAMVVLAALTEYAGVLGLMVGASRRYEGPMGKSDRAFVVGVLGLLLATGWVGAGTVNGVVLVMALLCLVTVVNRVRAGLAATAAAAETAGADGMGHGGRR